MREGRRTRTSFLVAVMVAALAGWTWGCLGTPEMEIPDPYDYDSRAILITNPDWGVIPLPNNFLNPVKQFEFVYIPGVPAPESVPVHMALPIVDETAAQVAQDLGYPVVEDGDLTKSLITGLNRLDGWITSFAPKIPFSKEPDYDSIVPFDGTNGATANLFLLDITNPAAPETIMPAQYYRVVNWERRTEYPYYLSLRLIPPGMLQAPADFLPGHTYAVVVTGIDEVTGIRAVTGVDAETNPVTSPVEVENTFLVFAARDGECPADGECVFSVEHPVTHEEVGLTYISEAGNPVNSVLTGLEAIQEAEGARQITNYVLKIWEDMDTVKDVRDRTEVVAAFQWTTVSNPMPAFFDAAAALMGGNPILPSPADYVSGDTVQLAKSNCDPSIGFSFKGAVNHDTVKTEAGTVKVYSVTGDTDKTLTEVPVTVTPTTTDGITSVLVKAVSALTPNTQYLVVATDGIMNVGNSRHAVDQTYFGLTRAGLAITDDDNNVISYSDTPLIGDDGNGGLIWNSPNLDSRLDTLLLSFAMANGIDPVAAPMKEITAEMLIESKDGGFGVMKVLGNLEGLRVLYKPLFDAVVLDVGLVESREDLVLGWTFTTGACI